MSQRLFWVDHSMLNLENGMRTSPSGHPTENTKNSGCFVRGHPYHTGRDPYVFNGRRPHWNSRGTPANNQ